MSSAAPDLGDVQGLVRSSYSTLPCARYLCLGFGPGANDFLTAMQPLITTANTRNAESVVQLALAASGLQALGLTDGELAGFPIEFTAGMTTPARSRFLGDVAASAPDQWAWGGPSTGGVDAFVVCLAPTDASIDQLVANVTRLATEHGVQIVSTLPTRSLGSTEPFGFRDGVSQPLVAELMSHPVPKEQTSVPLGEFLLGYTNSYGNLTDRPLVDPGADPGHLLAVDATTGRADLGVNGTYLAVRTLRQDVAAFDEYVRLTAQAQQLSVERVGATLVGRWPSGAPLVLAPDIDRPELGTANDFGYAAEDPDGFSCPRGAHVRRANPRDHLDGRAQDLAVTNRHRILRRGRQFGPTNRSAPQGLHFIAVNANLSRQFEFIQHTWLNNPKFDELYDDVDPIAGARSPQASRFTVQGRPVRRRYPQLPSFVTTIGGGYFFLPSVRALRYLAQRRPGR